RSRPRGGGPPRPARGPARRAAARGSLPRPRPTLRVGADGGAGRACGPTPVAAGPAGLGVPGRGRARLRGCYDVAWFEEPLRPDALEDHARLRSHGHVPIAGGEVLTRRQSFAP